MILLIITSLINYVQGEKMKRIKTKAVRSQRIAWLLRKEGFKIIDVTPNRRRPNLDVYIFEATPELCTALDTHIQNKDNRRDN